LFGAHWPEPTTNSTCHDDEMIKIIQAHKIVIYISLIVGGSKTRNFVFMLCGIRNRQRVFYDLHTPLFYAGY
ncbi:hypothetical protein, partial [Hoylesella shahii]|uniref:hypothetical protein n=1 Tax=Hoylesella shahii TaxID=228603 RepID=UPI0028DBF22D